MSSPQEREEALFRAAVELWWIITGKHIPTLSLEFSPRVFDWLLAHTKPCVSLPTWNRGYEHSSPQSEIRSPKSERRPQLEIRKGR